ncbi:site-2 protease family protein [Amycolatopsis sp. FDAARGOS 1241]|uniref:site-2 protease family protein n=1 Tax=Amycolatopsis sp. FDAARGOS 1241 TaxID=2778070 RepID=UPI00194F2848|nr:site-2 protease family protein [Amycolatopsis sp. FDAARGOS 1241]QRP42911.1 site-2 protease family protein [Amycolatopsis sp. FDAARGOS 1241]
MTHATFPLGRIVGIRIGAHWSVLIIAVLLAYLLATSVLPAGAPGTPPPLCWAVATVCAVLFLASLLAHELCHAFTARRCGLKAERITLWLLGGAAELPEEPRTPRAALLVAAAGPAASVAVAGGFLGAAVLATGALPPVVVVALTWLGWTNAVLAAFNLLPGTPLDGGRIAEAVAWKVTGDRARARRIAGRGGQLLAAALVGTGVWIFLTTGSFEGLWLVAIGWFLTFAVRNELVAAPLREAVSRIRLADVMRPSPVTAPGWYTVQGFLDLAAELPVRTFPVMSFDGRPVGVVSLGRLARVPETARTSTRLESVCTKPPACFAGPPETPVTEVLGRTALRPGQDLVLVVDHGALAGVVAPADLARALELAELGVLVRRRAEL